MTTVIVDYESGNLHSAEKAFQRMASETNAGAIVVTSDPDLVRKADRIVLPGDGAFPACKAALFGHSGLFEAIEEVVIGSGKPFFGICIGMQMLATRGMEYRETDGFDWIGGEVVHISDAGGTLKVPHMGWNDLVIDHAHPVLDGIMTGDHVYFVHSYHMQTRNADQRIAHVDYGLDLTAIVGRDNIFGTQFHPEKSQSVGLQIIGNFLRWNP